MTTIGVSRPAWHARSHMRRVPVPPWTVGLGRHRRSVPPSWRAIATAMVVAYLVHPVVSAVTRWAWPLVAVAGAGLSAVYVLAELWLALLATVTALTVGGMAWDAWVAWHLPQDRRRATLRTRWSPGGAR